MAKKADSSVSFPIIGAPPKYRNFFEALSSLEAMSALSIHEADSDPSECPRLTFPPDLDMKVLNAQVRHLGVRAMWKKDEAKKITYLDIQWVDQESKTAGSCFQNPQGGLIIEEERGARAIYGRELATYAILVEFADSRQFKWARYWAERLRSFLIRKLGREGEGIRAVCEHTGLVEFPKLSQFINDPWRADDGIRKSLIAFLQAAQTATGLSWRSDWHVLSPAYVHYVSKNQGMQGAEGKIDKSQYSPKLRSMKELAQAFQVTDDTVRTYIKTGQVRAFKVNGKWRVHREDDPCEAEPS